MTDIWKPDTFFVNGRKSKLHKITVPNRFSRLTPDGTVSYSQRLTISANCPMGLFKFPLDSQVCPLQISSYGYPGEELVYKWKTKALGFAKIQMAQFLYMRFEHGVNLNITNRKLEAGRRVDSVAFVHFFVERQTGYFLLQVRRKTCSFSLSFQLFLPFNIKIYAPLLLIVFCSWVGFWIVKTDVPGRAGLGITTVLSIAKIGFVGGAGKPQVPYAPAMDTFVIICFVFVFASLIEVRIVWGCHGLLVKCTIKFIFYEYSSM